jgi:hypothetical protein
VVKKLLARFTLKKAIGLFVGERDVTVCQVADTLLGPVETDCQSEPYAAEQLPDVIGRLLKPMLGRRKRRHLVAVGIPALRVFFSTRPIRNANRDTPAEALLYEVLQSPNVLIDDMAVEVIRAEPGKRQLASIVACRKKYLAGILDIVKDQGVRPFRAEPGPCAVVRAAAQQRRAPRRSKTALRVVLGNGKGLAVVMTGNLAVLWRFFNLPAGSESSAICSAIRSVQTLVGHCGIDSPVDVVLLHGRNDLRANVETDEFREQVGVPLTWCGAPELNDRGKAWGLALGCLSHQAEEAFDLSRSMKPRLPLREIFPWAEVAVQVALAICMFAFLTWRCRTLDEALVPVRVEIAQRAWLEKALQAQLQKEQTDLQQKVEAIRRFAGTRIIWTEYTHDIAERLPPTATLVSFTGQCELETPGKQAAVKPKKSFVLRASALIEEDGAVPKEVDRFMTALRDDPLLMRDFPQIVCEDIKHFQPNVTVDPSVLFTVLCLPKAAGGSPKPADKSEKTH